MVLRQRSAAAAGEAHDLPTLLAQGAGAPSVKPRGKPSPGKPRAVGDKEEFAMKTVPLLIDVDASPQQSLEGYSLNEELVRVRRALYLDFGVPFPGIHLRFHEGLKDGDYLIQLQEVPVATSPAPGSCWCRNAATSWNCWGCRLEEGDPKRRTA